MDEMKRDPSDLKSRRLALIDRLYARAERVLDRLEAPTYMYRLTTAAGVETFADDFPPSNDEKNLAAAVSTYLRVAADLELRDDGDGLAPVESMLGRLAQRFGLTGD